MQTIGQALQQILDENHITQADVARETGLSTKHVNWVVKGRAPLSIEVAVLIEEKFPKVKAFPLLMTQLRQDVARVKHRRRREKVNIAPLDAFDEPKADLFEYAPGQE